MLVFFLFVGATANAAQFANQFVEFKLPSKWICSLEGSEWVCQSKEKDKSRDAIIVLAAKLRGDQDSLDQYLAFLKKAKSFKSIGGKPVKSEPKYAQMTKLNEHPWVDSLHLESEIPGFYTRYLATIKRDIGVLVTYSINKAKYKDYQSEFEDMVRTLKVFRKSGGLNAAPKGSSLFDLASPQKTTPDTIFPDLAKNQSGSDGRAESKGDSGDDLFFFIILIGLVVAVIVILRKRRGPSP